MAEKKRKKRSQYQSQNTIDTVSDARDEVDDLVNNNGNVNTIADTLRRQQGNVFSRPDSADSTGLAPFNSSANPARTSTSINNGGGSLASLGKQVTQRPPLNNLGMQRSYPDVSESSLPSFVDDSPRFSSVTPFGGFSLQPNIKELLAEQEASPADGRFNDLVTRVSSSAPGASPEYAPGSPEAKLAAAMANTNPAPRSVWKRLGASLLRGAGQVKPGDAPETMLGKLIGNVIPGLVPQVDSRVQYEDNVSRAKEQFVTESAIDRSKRERAKFDQDIKESNERIAQGQQQRNTQAQTQAILNQTRLDNVTRQRAEAIMEGLSKLPENDPQREALATLLAQPPYNIPVGRNYGLLAGEQKQSQQRGKPLSESDLKRVAETNIRAKYNPDEKARASTDARRDAIARDIRDREFGGSVTTANREAYNKRVKDEYNNILESNKAFSKAEYDRLVAAEIDRLRNEEASPASTQSNKRVTRSSARVGDERQRVPASNTARGTDFRGVTIRLPGAKR